MTLGPTIQRTAWGLSWVSAALSAIALAVLVHLLMADAPLREVFPQIALCAVGMITLSMLCVTSAALALTATPPVPAEIMRTDRWDSIGSHFGTETQASRAA